MELNYHKNTGFNLIHTTNFVETLYSPTLVRLSLLRVKTCQNKCEMSLTIKPWCSVAVEPGESKLNGSLDEGKNSTKFTGRLKLSVYPDWYTPGKDFLLTTFMMSGDYGDCTHTHTHSPTGMVYWIEQGISIAQSLCHLTAVKTWILTAAQAITVDWMSVYVCGGGVWWMSLCASMYM